MNPNLDEPKIQGHLRTKYTVMDLIVRLLVFLTLVQPSLSGAIEKHALLIGIGDYRDSGLPDLAGPTNDIDAVRELLTDKFGFRPDHVVTLRDDQASHTGLRDAFARLLDAISPADHVYIHYSGHGSYTPDLNGDEPRGYDQTWVSHGARHRTGETDDIPLDEFDVLDDELQTWLAPLRAKAGVLVFVSDSCHSASVSRGLAPRSRAVDIDRRPHPLGRQPTPAASPSSGIWIGAARDHESAREHRVTDSETYGLFTWYWLKALRSAGRGETWGEVFKRTRTLILADPRTRQVPQISGADTRDLFDGQFVDTDRTITVLRVRDRGSRALLAAGKLDGVTVGSVYAPVGDEGDPNSLTVTISEVRATRAWGTVSATGLEPGGLLKEVEHRFPFAPRRVYLGADFPQTADAPLLEALRAMVEDLPALRETGEQSRSDIVLRLVRPRPGEAAADPTTLPEGDRQQAPQVWVLTPGEALYHRSLKIPFAEATVGVAALRKNLLRILRVEEVKRLSNPGQPSPVAMDLALYRPVEQCTTACERFNPGGETKTFRRSEWLPSKTALDRLDIDTLADFRLRNRSDGEVYAYLVDIAPNGAIRTLFPNLDGGMTPDDARLPPGKSAELRKDHHALLHLSHAGEENVKLIASRHPLNIELLNQDHYDATRQDRISGPLDRLLLNASTGTRQPVSAKKANWATTDVVFTVGDDR